MITFSVKAWNISVQSVPLQIDNVVMDDYTPNGSHRIFITEEGVQHEVPTENMVFEFSKERQALVIENRRLKAEAKEKERLAAAKQKDLGPDGGK